MAAFVGKPRNVDAAVVSGATGDRSVSSYHWHRAAVDNITAELVYRGVRPCARASRLGRKSFVGQLLSSTRKGITARPSQISCARPASKKGESTGTLKASKSLREKPSSTLGRLPWMRVLKEPRR